jgi:DNA-directed RNA polymerase specialized sigma24 family protein
LPKGSSPVSSWNSFLPRAVLSEGVERLLRALPDPTLRQVALWKLEGYTSEEIAAREKLDCAERTVERKPRLIREIWEQMELCITVPTRANPRSRRPERESTKYQV